MVVCKVCTETLNQNREILIGLLMVLVKGENNRICLDIAGYVYIVYCGNTRQTGHKI